MGQEGRGDRKQARCMDILRTNQEPHASCAHRDEVLPVADDRGGGGAAAPHDELHLRQAQGDAWLGWTAGALSRCMQAPLRTGCEPCKFGDRQRCDSGMSGQRDAPHCDRDPAARLEEGVPQRPRPRGVLPVGGDTLQRHRRGVRRPVGQRHSLSPNTHSSQQAQPTHLLLRHLDAGEGLGLEAQSLVVEARQGLAAPPGGGAGGLGQEVTIRIANIPPCTAQKGADAGHSEMLPRHAKACLSATHALPLPPDLFSISKSLSADPAPSARRSPLSSAPRLARRLATAPVGGVQGEVTELVGKRAR